MAEGHVREAAGLLLHKHEEWGLVPPWSLSASRERGAQGP